MALKETSGSLEKSLNKGHDFFSYIVEGRKSVSWIMP